MIKIKFTIFCLIVLAFAALPASANMVTDGGFEFGHGGEDNVTAWGNGVVFGAWTCFSSGAASVLLSDVVDGIVWGQIIPEGSEAVHIGEGATFTYITQEISGFVVGETYEVTLAALSYNSNYAGPGEIELYNAVDEVSDLYEDFDATVGGWDGSAWIETPFLYTSHQFVASNTDLVMNVINPGGRALTVDDISLVLVPEPATICLLGLGGLLLRRKR